MDKAVQEMQFQLNALEADADPWDYAQEKGEVRKKIDFLKKAPKNGNIDEMKTFCRKMENEFPGESFGNGWVESMGENMGEFLDSPSSWGQMQKWSGVKKTKDVQNAYVDWLNRNRK